MHTQIYMYIFRQKKRDGWGEISTCTHSRALTDTTVN